MHGAPCMQGSHCHARARVLVSLYRPPPPRRPTLDQFAVGVPRSESLQILYASLDCLGLRQSALHEDQVTGSSEHRPL